MPEPIRYVTYYTEWGNKANAPVIKCGCGKEVICDSFTNTCDCGQEYNFAGQALKPRDEWEEPLNED